MTTFEDFYALFPRKKSRADARKAWDQALKKGFDGDEIIAGLRTNLSAMRAKDPQFVPYPASWLRDEAWADEPDRAFKPIPQRRTFRDAADEFDARYNSGSASFGLSSIVHNRH